MCCWKFIDCLSNPEIQIFSGDSLDDSDLGSALKKVTQKKLTMKSQELSRN